MKLQFWFEFASTYSYPAVMRVGKMAEARGVELEWRPFLLGPLFHAQQGMKDSPFNVVPVKGSYMWRIVWGILRWRRCVWGGWCWGWRWW